LNHWPYPFSWEAALTADVFDSVQLLALALAGKTGQFKPHPSRPWVKQPNEHHGNTGGRSREEVEDLLARAKAGQFKDGTSRQM